MVPPVPTTNKGLLMALVIIITFIVITTIGISVHSCIYNPDGPDEFSVGYASRP